MRTPSVGALAAIAGLSLSFVPAAAQTPLPVTVGIGAGVFATQDDLGHAYPLPSDGHLRLDRLRAAPAVDASVLLRTGPLGLRPVVRVAYAPSRAIPSSWRPCEPWAACPSILIEPETRVSRLHVLAGVELPLLGLARGGDVFATFAAGGRRYGISWEEWGGPPENSFYLPKGSAGAWDATAQAGAGVTFDVGAVAVVAQWSVSWSDYGPGVRSGPDGSGSIGTADLGRRGFTQHAASVGVRKALR